MFIKFVEHLILITVTKNSFFIKDKTIDCNMIWKMVKNGFIYLNVNKKRLFISYILEIKGLLIHVNLVKSFIL